MEYTCKALEDSKIIKLELIAFSLFPTGLTVYGIYALITNEITYRSFVFVLSVSIPMILYMIYLLSYKIILNDIELSISYFFKDRIKLNLEQSQKEIIRYHHGKVFQGIKIKYHKYNKVKINGGYQFDYCYEQKVHHVSDQLVKLLKINGFSIISK